jgi:hypothetical protein
MPLSTINSNSFSSTANTTLGGASASLSRLTVLNTTSSNVSAAAGSRGPIASFRGGNDNNRFDVQVDNSGPRCNVSLSAWNVAGAASQMIFNAGATGASEAMRIDTGGVVVLTNGQIAFPATQNSSADANTLDDYEEGTWTPTFSSVSGSLTAFTSGGYYVKIGGLVTIYGWVRITTAGTASGGGRVLNLPFSVSNATGYYRNSGSCHESQNTGQMYQFFTVDSGTVYILSPTNTAITWTAGYTYPFQLTYQST